jgi:squalene cyclase
MISTAIVHNVLQQQMADGRWLGWSPRAPLEGGDIQATALAIRSLKLYPIAGRQEEINTRVNRAAKWLRTARPVTTEEFAMRLLGLHWSETSAAEVKAAAKQLAALQREDGGWAQLPTLSSDAYATGKSVFALRTALGEQADSAGIRNGIAFLRKTQLADGTWFTKTRAFPFQPLVDTGLPHGRDQWISAAATSWALIALMPAL